MVGKAATPASWKQAGVKVLGVCLFVLAICLLWPMTRYYAEHVADKGDYVNEESAMEYSQLASPDTSKLNSEKPIPDKGAKRGNPNPINLANASVVGMPDQRKPSVVGDAGNLFDNIDTDGDGISDRLELLDGTEPDDPNSYLDTDEDSVPDRLEIADGTDPNDPYSFSDIDNDGIPDRYEPLEITTEFLETYREENNNKALVYLSTGSLFVSGHTSPEVVARLALEACKLESHSMTDAPRCHLANINGRWIKDYDPPRLSKTAGLSMITSERAITAFQQYSKKSGNKAFVYSQGGEYGFAFDSRKSVDVLSKELLQECRKMNKFESKYPCTVINTNGEWNTSVPVRHAGLDDQS